MRNFLMTCAMAAGALAVPAGALAQTFGYFGDIGPSHWADLSSAWTTCGTGETQSPVNFTKLPAHPTSVRKLSIEYDPNTTGAIFNNGHTIEVETEGFNRLTLGDVEYELSQFHFHAPSEHRVDDQGFEMELHLVHTAVDGSIAVIGVFLKRGASSGALAPIFDALPNDINVHHPLAQPFHPAAFLPRNAAHYRYVGSLTTPPCTEGVEWVVAKEPITVSDEHLAQFAERIHFNARPVQRRK